MAEDLLPSYTQGLQIGAQIGHSIAQNYLQQQAQNRLMDQLQFAQGIQQREQAIRDAEAARQATLFQQRADYANQAKFLPGGGDFEYNAGAPGEQQRMDAIRHSAIEDLNQNYAPQDILPKLLESGQHDYEMQQRLQNIYDAKNKIELEKEALAKELTNLREGGKNTRQGIGIASRETIAGNKIASTEGMFNTGQANRVDIADKNRTSREYVDAVNNATRVSEGALGRQSRADIAATIESGKTARAGSKGDFVTIETPADPTTGTPKMTQQIRAEDLNDYLAEKDPAAKAYESVLRAQAAGETKGVIRDGAFVPNGGHLWDTKISDLVKEAAKQVQLPAVRRAVEDKVKADTSSPAAINATPAGATNAPTGPAIDPLPDKESDLVVDKLYKTKDFGVRRWNGKHLVKP